jgi:heptosyltransferase-2
MKKRILVIRFSSLGDVILTTALFPNLKAYYPDSEVTVLTKSAYAPIFNGNPSVDRVLPFNAEAETFSDLARQVREQNFDMIIDLHGNLRSWFLRFVAGPPLSITVDKATLSRWALLFFKISTNELKKSVRERILEVLTRLAIPIINTETQLFPSHLNEVISKFDLPQNQSLIGIAPGAKHATKRWPVERFAEAANRLGAFPNTTVILLGDESDRPVGEQVAAKLVVNHRNLIGKTSLPELTAVVSRLSFLLTNDSGILHMAEALKIPLVSIFGPTVRAFGFAPYRSSSRVVEVSQLKCRPCTLHGDEVCPLKHHNCMKDVDVSAVMLAASSLLTHLSVEASGCSLEQL